LGHRPRSTASLRAVTFDAAGTLIVPAEPVLHTYARVAAHCGLVTAPATSGDTFARIMAEAPPLAFGDPPPEDLAARERGWWVAVVARTLGVADDAPGFAACFDALYDHYGRAEAWTVVPAARAVLTTLRRRRFGIAVISNFDRRLHGLLAALQLAPALDAVLVSVEVGWAKPAPEIFRRAFRVLGVPAAAVLHVGDDAHADAGGALAAGAQAALVGTRRIGPGMVRLASLTEVPIIGTKRIPSRLLLGRRRCACLTVLINLTFRFAPILDL
jgi:putative hydrolase of the HAD superfamily